MSNFAAAIFHLDSDMLRDFVAIDFETANQQASSVCSVGVVMVRNGREADKFYSLIQPEPNYYSYFCQRVHPDGLPPSVRFIVARPPFGYRSRRLRLYAHPPSSCLGRCRSLCRHRPVPALRSRKHDSPVFSHV